jgi:hypothetical protein
MNCWRRGMQVLMVTVVTGTLAACGTSPASRQDSPAQAGATTTVATGARPFRLYTHCGIDEALMGNRYFEAVHPLSDGQGNPPAGWGNPYQDGTMTLVSSTEAVFRDVAGHRVPFRLRSGARTFKHVCS